jgi:hypothetical protein
MTDCVINHFLQVNCQLSHARSMFGKLTSMYCTWYFWRSDYMLHVSTVEHYKENEKGNKDIYLNHMKKTLVLIIAAIHQKSPAIYGRALGVFDLTRGNTKPSNPISVASFRDAVAFKAWKFLVSCWTWVRHFKTRLFLCILSCFSCVSSSRALPSKDSIWIYQSHPFYILEMKTVVSSSREQKTICNCPFFADCL